MTLCSRANHPEASRIHPHGSALRDKTPREALTVPTLKKIAGTHTILVYYSAVHLRRHKRKACSTNLKLPRRVSSGGSEWILGDKSLTTAANTEPKSSKPPTLAAGILVRKTQFSRYRLGVTQGLHQTFPLRLVNRLH